MSKLTSELAPIHIAHEEVVTPWEQKGTVMRRTMERAKGRSTVLVDIDRRRRPGDVQRQAQQRLRDVVGLGRASGEVDDRDPEVLFKRCDHDRTRLSSASNFS